MTSGLVEMQYHRALVMKNTIRLSLLFINSR